MKILIGIHCNDKNHAHKTALTLREELNLLAHHMRQPALDAAAILCGVTSYEIQKRPEHYSNVTPWNQSAQQLEAGIARVILAGNPNAFTQAADEWLNNEGQKPLRNMFSGYLIHGISTNEEADFIRTHGGLMIHILKTENPRQIDVLNGDRATHYCRAEEPCPRSLKQLAILIKKHFAVVEQSKAA